MHTFLSLAAISGDAILKHGGIALVILAVLAVVWWVVSYYEMAGIIGKIIKAILILLAALTAVNFLLSLIGKAFIDWG